MRYTYKYYYSACRWRNTGIRLSIHETLTILPICGYTLNNNCQKICSILYKYILLQENKIMKTLSLKLDDEIFEEAEELTSKLKLARNRYINEAVSIYNLYNKRRLLKMQLMKESKLTSKDSMDVLHEFEKLMDED